MTDMEAMTKFFLEAVKRIDAQSVIMNLFFLVLPVISVWTKNTDPVVNGLSTTSFIIFLVINLIQTIRFIMIEALEKKLSQWMSDTSEYLHKNNAMNAETMNFVKEQFSELTKSMESRIKLSDAWNNSIYEGFRKISSQTEPTRSTEQKNNKDSLETFSQSGEYTTIEVGR